MDEELLFGEAKDNGYVIPEVDRERLLNRYQQQQSELQPYREALQNYLNNYDALIKKNYNAQRYLTALSGLTKNAGYRDMAKDINPVATEAQKLQLMRQIAEEKIKQTTGEDELLGNAYIAQQAGMSPYVALGSKDVFKTISPIMSSMNALRGKMYSADRSIDRAKLLNDARIKVAQMNNARAMAIAQGTWNTQKEIAFNRDKANMQRALVQAIGFGADPSQLLGTTNSLGLTDVDIQALQKYMDGDL